MNINWKRSGAIVAASALILTASACSSGGSAGGDAPSEIVIGGIHPRTGASSYYGLPMDQGVQLAVDTINKAGGVEIGGSSVKLRYDPQDDKSDPTAGVAALKKLTSDGANFVVGPLGGAVVQALKPIVDGSDTLLLIDGAADSSPGLLDPEGMFRLPPSYATMDKSLISTIGDKHYAKVAILNDKANPTFAGSVDAVVSGITSAGSSVSDVKSFSTGDADFRAQLTGLLASGSPDAIIIRGYALESARITAQARELGYTGQLVWEVLAPPATVSANATEKDMAGVIDVIYATPDFLQKAGDKKMIAFNDAYRAAYKKDPGSLSAFSYDAIISLAAAIDKADSVDPAAVEKALGSLKVSDVDLANTYVPYDGDALFDSTGQAQFAPVNMQWRDGDWYPQGK